MYNYKIFQSVTKECEKILNDEEKKLSSNFFQNLDYIKEIIKIKNHNYKIVVIYDNKTVLAILPFEIKRYFFIKVLQWIGTEFSDYCNPILSKNLKLNLNKKYFLDAWNAIINELKDELDIVFLNNQLSIINDQVNPFVKFFETSNFSTVYNISMEGDFNDYKNNIKIINKKYAYEIHRTLIKYEKLKNLSKNLKIDIQESDKIPLDFKKIINEKKNQLDKKNINNKLGGNFERIFENLIETKNIKFCLISLVVESKVLSRCFGIIYQNTFYYYIPTVLPNPFENFKPGKILILQIIQWCIKNNITKFDFGLGGEKYKKYFSNKEISLHRYIKSYNFKGFLAYSWISFVLKIKKLWL